MTAAPGLWVVDTNVVVAGLLARDGVSPPAVVLDRMLTGSLRHLLSVELLTEYRDVLLRERIRSRHGLGSARVDALLEALAMHAVLADDMPGHASAPDPGDQHLWNLLTHWPDAGLITGDDLLIRSPPWTGRVVSPREWCGTGPVE